MKLYKVLNKDLTSPYQGFQFELGKKYVCDNFDTSDNECSKGFYAVDFNGLVYAINRYGKKHSVFEVELGGRSKEFNQFKRRYEEITILRELAEDEIKTGLLACEESEGYKVCEACYPIHPFRLVAGPVTDHEIDLLKKWASLGTSLATHVRASVAVSLATHVRDSVWDSLATHVWDSVWRIVGDSVGGSTRASVWASAGPSVRDSLGAYISSLFPGVKFQHDFSPCVELWRSGFVPSFDGETWRLHAAKGIVWEGVIS